MRAFIVAGSPAASGPVGRAAAVVAAADRASAVIIS